MVKFESAIWPGKPCIFDLIRPRIYAIDTPILISRILLMMVQGGGGGFISLPAATTDFFGDKKVG
jgi:hypothetical protein